MKSLTLFSALVLLAVLACHPGPVITTDPKQPVGGTVAGIVSSTTNAPVVGRKVTAVNTESGARFDATTGANGGYTIKVPEGRYRLEIELLQGESISKQPSETRLNKSDLDTRRDFVLAGVRAGG
jgi:hypothetical protein